MTRAVLTGLLALLAAASGCAGAASRALDPAHAGEVHVARMRFRFEPGVSSPELLGQVEPGDLIALSADTDKGNSSTVLAVTLSQVSHVALVYPSLRGKLRVVSADSDQGVYIDTLENAVKGRDFYVYSFPPGLLDLPRVEEFAQRAVFLGRLDYDWSAMFGLNSNLTPNSLREIGDEHTCATAVAAGLHYAGLSLDRGWRGVVTPGDVVHSPARRNLNGPAMKEGAREGAREGRKGR